MLRDKIRIPLNGTATVCRREFLSSSSLSSFFSFETAVTQLTRLTSLLEGRDYQRWLVVTEAPLRDEIVNGYVKTLAMAVGSEEEAKKSMYSVSTKYKIWLILLDPYPT